MLTEEIRRLGQRALSAKHAGDTAMMNVWLDFILDAQGRDVEIPSDAEALEAPSEESVTSKAGGAPVKKG